MAAAGDRRPATEAEINALASPTRIRILQLALDESLTNRELAQRLGITPASSHYHVRRLLAVGLLEAKPTKTRSVGGVEIPYRSTRRSWQLELAPEDRPTHAMLRAFVDEVSGIDRGDVEDAIRWHARLTDERRIALAARLKAVLDEFAVDDADGTPWSVFIVVHR